MHWSHRFLAALALGVICEILTIPLQRLAVPPSPVAGPTLRDHLATAVPVMALAVHSYLPILVSLAIYAVLTYRYRSKMQDAETRCRKCGYILRGISEPRCPECGEGI